MAGLNTVNIIQFNGPSPTDVENIWSFPDDKQGNKDAEAKLIAIAKKLDPNVLGSTIEDGFDFGFIEIQHWTLLYTHSVRKTRANKTGTS